MVTKSEFPREEDMLRGTLFRYKSTKPFSNLKAVLNRFYFLNRYKHKYQTVRGQWGIRKTSDIRRIDLKRQGCVCPRLLYFLRQTAKTTSESHRGLFRTVTWSPQPLDVLDHRWHDAHTRSKWHSPSICEESAKSESFSLKWKFT